MPGLGIESAMLAECLEEAHRHSFKSVFGNPSFGFSETTLDFLYSLPGIQAVWFWDIDLKNIDALYTLSSLEYFGVHDKRPAIDFSRFPALKDMIWSHKPKDAGVSKLKNLQLLHVWHYRPKSKSFTDLQLPDTLNELQIIWANPTSLDGLKPIASLRRLEIHRCRNLASLALIPQLFPQLEQLIISGCGRVSSIEGTQIALQLPFLKHAFVQDSVVLSR